MKTVLVVDDDVTCQKVLSSFIERIGHKPIEVSSGQQALQVLTQSKVDLMILDLNMPVVNGYAVLQSCAEKKISLPIIICSETICSPASVEFIHAKKRYQYLEKPLAFEKFEKIAKPMLA